VLVQVPQRFEVIQIVFGIRHQLDSGVGRDGDDRRKIAKEAADGLAMKAILTKGIKTQLSIS
jgi:hypothetical protein